MKLDVYVSNAEWECEVRTEDDRDEHPPDFEAVVELPDDTDFTNQLAVDAAIHDALIWQCDCCLVEGDFFWDLPEVGMV